jgi:hypothetical protein
MQDTQLIKLTKLLDLDQLGSLKRLLIPILAMIIRLNSYNCLSISEKLIERQVNNHEYSSTGRQQSGPGHICIREEWKTRVLKFLFFLYFQERHGREERFECTKRLTEIINSQKE